MTETQSSRRSWFPMSSATRLAGPTRSGFLRGSGATQRPDRPDHRRASRSRRQAHGRRQLSSNFAVSSTPVRCAIEVQNAMVERNAGYAPEDRRIVFRMGIHLGDVVEESDGDLMGDGVNVAARLEKHRPTRRRSASQGRPTNRRATGC